MVPVIWDNETGAAVEVDCAKPGGSGIYYTLWPVQVVRRCPGFSCLRAGVISGVLPVGPSRRDTLSPAMDLSGTNVNVVSSFATVVLWRRAEWAASRL